MRTAATGYTLTATGSGGTASDTKVSSTFNITPAAAASLILSTVTTTKTAGTSFSQSVTAKDAYANIATGYTGTVAMTSSDGQFVSAPSSHAFVSGDAGTYSFTLTLKTAGTQTFTATDSGNSLSIGSGNITVNAATTPGSIAVSSGNSGQSAAESTALGSPFVAVVKDAYSNVISGAQVDWVVTAGGGTLSSGASSNTNSNGLASNTLTTGGVGTAGTDTVTATTHVGGYQTSFSATTNGASFTYNWPFTTGTDSNFSCVKGGSTYTGASGLNQCSMDITGNLVELTASSQSDSNNNAIGFGGATMTGGAQWDSTNSYARLSTTSPNLELDASWTPAWSNIMGYWKLNEASGATSVVDTGPVGTNTGTPNSVTLGASGKLNNAGSFNGSSSVITVPWPMSQNFTTAIQNGTVTYCAWINPTSFPTEVGVMGVGDPGSGGLNLALMSGKVAFWYAGGTILKTSSAIVTGQWTHLCGVATSLSSINIYVNGILTFTGSSGLGSFTLAPVSNQFVIGNEGAVNASRYLNGSLDDVAIWNTALSTSAINTLYQHQSAKYTGTITSRVMDGLSTGQSWTTLGWTPTLPFFKSLPDSGNSESSSNYASITSSLMNGIVALWHLDDVKGSSTVADSVSNNTGTAGSGVTLGAVGKFNTGATFNGTTNGYITINSGTNLYNLSTGTISGWINGGGDLLGNFTNGSASNRFLISLNSNIYVIFSNSFFCFSNNTFSSNVWHHITYTSVHGSATFKLYVDGVLQTGLTCWAGTNPTDAFFSDILTSSDSIQLGNNSSSGSIHGTSGLNSIDEIAIWNRALSQAEVTELYRRGANRLLYQVRTCSDSACASPSPSSPGWVGPDGTTQSYFSELYNTTSNYLPAPNTSPAPAPSPVLSGLPTMTFANFSSVTIPTNRYFQYRAILESDDANTLCNYGGGANTAPCSPELQSVTVGPTHYDNSSPAIYNTTGSAYATLSAFSETLGGSGCAAGSTYNVSKDKSTWYWWNSVATSNCGATSGGSGAWCTADGTKAKSNAASVINTNAASFATQLGTGTVYVKTYLNSNGTQACQITNDQIQGTQ